MACLMQQAGLRAVHKRRRTITTDSQCAPPVAPNLLQLDFSASVPNTQWLTDIKAIWTEEEWLTLMRAFTQATAGGMTIPKREKYIKRWRKSSTQC